MNVSKCSCQYRYLLVNRRFDLATIISNRHATDVVMIVKCGLMPKLGQYMNLSRCDCCYVSAGGVNDGFGCLSIGHFDATTTIVDHIAFQYLNRFLGDSSRLNRCGLCRSNVRLC